MPTKEYFGKPGMSFHQLLDFSKSPAYYYKKHTLKQVRDDDKQSYAFGRAFHSWCGEGREVYDQNVMIVPDEHLTPSGAVSTRKETRAWLAEQEGKTLISRKDHETIEAMVLAVHSNPICQRIMRDGLPEVEKFCVIITDFGDICCKACIDWLTPHAAIDFKSIDNIDNLERHCLDYHYDGQLAFYEDIANVQESYLIFAEKSGTNRVAVVRFDPSTIVMARGDNYFLLERYAECCREAKWPNDPQHIITVSRPRKDIC
jgi:hypothetical protein